MVVRSSEKRLHRAEIALETATARELDKPDRQVPFASKNRSVRTNDEFRAFGAPVDLEVTQSGQLKVIALCQEAARSAIEDAALDWSAVDRDRFACAISGHMGDTAGIAEIIGLEGKAEGEVPAWHQWMPNTACSEVAREHGLFGPRSCHSTACASGLIDILSAVRRIRDGQCDLALAGSAEAINPLFAAGFRQLRVGHPAGL